MLYVFVDTVERQLNRIEVRVADGGHDVPAERVATRRGRSFEPLCWFARNMDSCALYDNSTGTPELAAEIIGGTMYRWDRLPADTQAIFDESGMTCTDDFDS